MDLIEQFGYLMSTKLVNIKSNIGSIRRWITPICSILMMFILTTPSFSQDKNKDQNKNDQKNLNAIPAAFVIEVKGSVDKAARGISPLADKGWTPVKQNDKLSSGTQIRTGLRSFVNLRFGLTTIISVRSATHANIEQFYQSATSENIRVGLAYGTVRGGSTKSTIHSDVIIDSPIATLAKRGTEGWQMWIEPATGRFNISLAQHGLVEAIQKMGVDQTRSREVRPGEYATQDNIANMWINQDIFDRNVQFYEPQWITEADATFTTFNNRGYGSLAPGAGNMLIDFSQRVSAEFVIQQTGSNRPFGTILPNLAILQPGPIRRPEGNFGTGNTLRILFPR